MDSYRSIAISAIIDLVGISVCKIIHLNKKRRKLSVVSGYGQLICETEILFQQIKIVTHFNGLRF